MEHFMRMIVFYDLPTVTPKEKKIHSAFRKFLLKDGFDMLQWSVYARIVNGIAGVNTHMSRIRKVLPTIGSVRCLVVTEKQYSEIVILVGDPKKQENKINSSQLLLF